MNFTGWADFLKSLFPDSYNTDAEVWDVILGAIGNVFDSIDPFAIKYSAAVPGTGVLYQSNYAKEFKISSASSPGLDECGADWEDPRKPGEDDTSYRNRLLSVLPIFTLGATVAGIKGVTKNFTGTPPDTDEWGLDAFAIGYSGLGDAYLQDTAGLFTFVVQINNPGGFPYNHLDLEAAVQRTKPARSTAIVIHNGMDTSPANEAATAQITIV